jgi:uncharacterized protein (TIGR00369 family)
MSKDPHFQALERMYRNGPINRFYDPRIEVSEAGATIEIDVSEKLFHAGRAVHGSVYFKMLDDAAFFAANSLEHEFFVLTSSFTIYLTRPLSSGSIRAEGRVVHRGRSQFIAESIAYDADGKEVARGSGVFVRSGTALRTVPGYDA